jgi:hypothetical protein
VLSKGLRVVRIRQGNQLRPVAALLHRYIPFWLATIHDERLDEQQRQLDDQRQQLTRVG